MAALPEQIAPMLCRIGRPFDSKDHLFEIKWDGVRALCFVDGGANGHRLHSRHRHDLRSRYPELGFLAALPPGLVLDGELVVLDVEGKADFPAILRRENSRGGAAGVARGVRAHPVVYVVFDLLYDGHEPWLARPLVERRHRLAEVVAACGNPRLMLSDGIVGAGLSLFAAVRERGIEGMVAKRLDSRYRPGERTDAWQKVKPVQVVHCAILGFEPDGENGFRSLIIATDLDGELRCVGKVGSGIGEDDRRRLWQLMSSRRRRDPWLDAGMDGSWVEPGLYCSVSYLERTASGSLRAPVFLELVEA